VITCFFPAAAKLPAESEIRQQVRWAKGGRLALRRLHEFVKRSGTTGQWPSEKIKWLLLMMRVVSWGYLLNFIAKFNH